MVAQTIFSNRLLQLVSQNIPGIDPISVLNTGATSLQDEFSQSQVVQILLYFMEALRDAFILPIALNGISFIIALAAEIIVRTGTRRAADKEDDKTDKSSEIKEDDSSNTVG
jgi:hypothetical protein